MKDILTVDDVAEWLGCAADTVRDAAACGDLPAFKMGRDWVFPRVALVERLNEKATDAAEVIRTTAERVARKLRGDEGGADKYAAPSKAQSLQDILNQQAKGRVDMLRGPQWPLPIRQQPPSLDDMKKIIQRGGGDRKFLDDYLLRTEGEKKDPRL